MAVGTSPSRHRFSATGTERADAPYRIVMKTRITGSLVVCAAAAAFTAGALLVNDDSSSSASAPAATAAPAAAPGAAKGAAAATLTIEGFAFGSVAAKPGATVNVLNQDSAGHTVTATNKAFNTGTVKGKSSTAFAAPTAPGSYAFFCAIHPDMKGVLVVS
jgi:plastocyanin